MIVPTNNTRWFPMLLYTLWLHYSTSKISCHMHHITIKGDKRKKWGQITHDINKLDGVRILAILSFYILFSHPSSIPGSYRNDLFAAHKQHSPYTETEFNNHLNIFPIKSLNKKVKWCLSCVSMSAQIYVLYITKYAYLRHVWIFMVQKTTNIPDFCHFYFVYSLFPLFSRLVGAIFFLQPILYIMFYIYMNNGNRVRFINEIFLSRHQTIGFFFILFEIFMSRILIWARIFLYGNFIWLLRVECGI